MAGLDMQTANSTVVPGERLLHTMLEGRSHDIALSTLDLGDLSTDEQVKQAVASHFSLPISKLAFFEVHRHENGNVTVRPPAVFG